MIRRSIESPAAMEALGAALAVLVKPGMRVFLEGELGAGKTTLVRGFLRQLGFTASVNSPSFTLVETYPLATATVFHLDLYRLQRPAELESIGFRDYFDRDGICLVEWAERAGTVLGLPDVRVRLRLSAAGRDAELEACTPTGERLLGNL